ncbi:TetR/AcrR family transcriptional regulator [Amycolatopsis taiwanensis]|uniref:TetR/AcrR family transcriptional regulator n=1 Tax=Amycolatopsis taiwanensis TaxID=342230 RepID=UPI000485AEF3|nr:TetR/AcrR family transcriptional regulator [Amycolatopsis taiwanensis]
MSQQAENVRVRRTRKLLREALVDLVEEHGFDRVTVGQITERALVSRAAFYRNYRDKYHLVEQIFDEAIAALVGTVPDARLPQERLAGFFEHIADYDRLYRALLGKKGSPWFAARMRASLSELSTQHLDVPADDLVPTVLGAMLVETITWWLDHGRPVPPREIAVQASRLAVAAVTEASSWTR